MSRPMLTVLITLRCPLQCAHCVVDSGPQRKESLDLELLLTIIDDAASLGVRCIGFTGGDPFVRLDDLRKCVSRARLHQLEPVVVTSGFWATSELRAFEILGSLGPLFMFGV